MPGPRYASILRYEDRIFLEGRTEEETNKHCEKRPAYMLRFEIVTFRI